MSLKILLGLRGDPADAGVVRSSSFSVHLGLIAWSPSPHFDLSGDEARPGGHHECSARAARLSVPEGMAVEPGSIVVAPLGPRQLLGVAWEAERLPSNDVPDTRFRPLAGLVDVPSIAAPLRRLCEWTADYYLSPWPRCCGW